MAAAFELIDSLDAVTIGAGSRAIAELPRLREILGLPNAVIDVIGRTIPDLYVGWGRRRSGDVARQAAIANNRPFLLLEDAFIRSARPFSVGHEPAAGLCLDDRGIYYDAGAPSRLESLIAQSAQKVPPPEAAALLTALRTHQISKYNSPRSPSAVPAANSFVVVVDQTMEDESVRGAGATNRTFHRMLEAARDEHRHRHILVKRHPETSAGKKRGYFDDLTEASNLTLIDAPINPWQLTQGAACLYTVSSQLGFEAILNGVDVRCFGVPFYAGWGLTLDDMTCSRRSGQSITVHGMLHAAYCAYARYVDPFNGLLISAQEAALMMSDRRHHLERNQGPRVFYKISGWKAAAVSDMFGSSSGATSFQKNKKKAIAAAAQSRSTLSVWSAHVDAQLAVDCENAGVAITRIEDGFIRSVGLGADLNRAASMVQDHRGIYYDSTGPSDLEVILERRQFDEAMLVRAARLIDGITKNNISKYNLRESPWPRFDDAGKRVILVPGQVETDASVLRSGGAVSSLEHLAAVRRDAPDAFIIFKPHPDVSAGLRPGLKDEAKALCFADKFAADASILDLIDSANEVHTISSLSGFEALMRRKAVVCYGIPFYAGWGLTRDLLKCERRTRKLSLEQLVAGALILYPAYFDEKTRLPCGPEVVMQRILEERCNPTPPSLGLRIRRAIARLRFKPPRI